MRLWKTKRQNQKGQAIILVLVALGLFLLGAIGLAIDGSHLYAQRQMAQAAADAAAQAAIMSIFNGTNTSGGNPDYKNAFGSSAFDCAANSTLTPCYYARLNGFDPANGDVVHVDFPASDPGTTLSASDPVALCRVTVIRTVNTSLMRFLGPATSKVAAQGTAAIVDVVAPVPIIVTHPNLSGSFFINGGPTITICGGPQRSIQVNSSSPTAISLSGSSNVVDLSKAGPKDDGFCNSGTGTDFGNFGGPESYPNAGGLLLGSTGKYLDHAAVILDPLKDILATPSQPTITQTNPLPVPNGVDGCPASPQKPCVLFLPGYYPSGINVKNQTALFAPGLYYIGNGGFGNNANGNMMMATCPAPAVGGLPAIPITGTDPAFGCGMMVYNSGSGVFNVGANSGANLLGPPDGPPYYGVLFFENRNAPANNGKNSGHRFGGGGGMTLIGTIYVNNLLSYQLADPTHYQRLVLQGTPGQQTLIRGEIITNVLELGGNAGIKMQLDPLNKLHIRQVALVR